MTKISPSIARNLLVCLLSSAVFPLAHAGVFSEAAARVVSGAVSAGAVTQIPADGQIEVGFSPKGGAEQLVLRVIDTSQSELKVMAYSFTSAQVTSALLRAAKRGVAISLVADEKHNLGNGASTKARAAFSALTLAGAQVRLTSAFAIHHDKIILADKKNIQLGSFNYSQSAATRNSENVMVNWGNPKLVAAYEKHFARNWALAQPFKPNY